MNSSFRSSSKNLRFLTQKCVLLAQLWHDVEVIDLEAFSRGAIKGKKRDTVCQVMTPLSFFKTYRFLLFSCKQEEVLYVIPCALSDTLNFAWFVLSSSFRVQRPVYPFKRLQDAFRQLFPHEIVENEATSATATENDISEAVPPILYLAITTQDTSIVYYKLSQGIVKPPV